jgi:hypothetical protein
MQDSFPISCFALGVDASSGARYLTETLCSSLVTQDNPRELQMRERQHSAHQYEPPTHAEETEWLLNTCPPRPTRDTVILVDVPSTELLHNQESVGFRDDPSCTQLKVKGVCSPNTASSHNHAHLTSSAPSPLSIRHLCAFKSHHKSPLTSASRLLSPSLLRSLCSTNAVSNNNQQSTCLQRRRSLPMAPRSRAGYVS